IGRGAVSNGVSKRPSHSLQHSRSDRRAGGCEESWEIKRCVCVCACALSHICALLSGLSVVWMDGLDRWIPYFEDIIHWLEERVEDGDWRVFCITTGSLEKVNWGSVPALFFLLVFFG